MSLVSTLRTVRILASQRPTTPPRSIAAPSRVHRERRGRVPITWIDRDRAADGIIVHLHGGDHLYGESRADWAWLEEVARRSGAAAVMIHHRLAPRFPFPAGLHDVLAVIEDLSEDVTLRPGHWVLSGEGSGAALALAAAQTLAEQGATLPAALLVESPWVDLTREQHDLDQLRTAAELYTASVPREDPRISPALADLAGLPPVLIVTGEHDELRQDAQDLATALTRAGTPRELVSVTAGRSPAVRGEGPAAQEARRHQIRAIREGLAP
ncbi:alpha/beta hydrolase fold domain-containing protein [Brachybacterium sp. UMB0905]|uniref:alpha/beta hydrolase fold domain-containing protein n=1 Tax=Brachybacterium sp. UMB0905 TaxID=2069310 RepID=UPI001E51E847|nr:alpha/beta hydrolase fold domain-containing protein [Brachybacterium sp. UMB0905]